MLPIGKVDGGENPADLMTKNVGIELAKKHMKKMGIRFADGRSDAAAKLHILEEKDAWSIGQNGTYLKATKTHKVARSELYLPGGEDEYPVHSSNLEATRITSGVTQSGKVFEIEDNWRRHGQGRRELAESWTGSTTFLVKASARKLVRNELLLTVLGKDMAPEPCLSRASRSWVSRRPTLRTSAGLSARA